MSDEPHKITIDSLKPGETYKVVLEVHYPLGKMSKNVLRFQGGQHLKLDSRDLLPIIKPKEVRNASHPGYICCIAFSPDGKMLATGDYNNQAILWNMRTGQRVNVFKRHTNTVCCLAFSPDGKTFATGSYGAPNSDDNTVILWDVMSRHMPRTVHGRERGTLCLAFSPDGKAIVTGSSSCVAILWDTMSGEKQRELKGSPQILLSTIFSPDGKIVVTMGTNNSMSPVLWDAKSGKRLKKLKGSFGTVHAARFSPNGQSFVTVAHDKKARIWDVQSGGNLEMLTDVAYPAAISPNTCIIAARLATKKGKVSKDIVLWDLFAGKKLKTLHGHSDVVSAFAFSPDGQTLASSSLDKTIILWDVKSSQILKRWSTQKVSSH